MNTHIKISFFVLICTVVVPVLTVAQWIQLNSGTSTNLNNIDCPTPDTCYAVGLSVPLKTIDGGNNWVFLNNGITTGNYKAIDCLNKDTCFAGNGTTNELYKTTDGGNSWSIKFVLTSVISIYIVNDSVGYATAGSGDYLKTTDGGETWQWLNLFPPVFSVTWPIYFIDEQTGFIGTQSVIDPGEIIKTNDGGNNWSVSLSVAICDFYDIDFPTDSIGYAVGSCDTGLVYKTIDQGANWNALYMEEKFGTGIGSIDCINKDTCYIVGNGNIIKTTDGGINWMFDTVGISSYSVKTVTFPSKTVGYGIGSGGLIVKTNITTGIKDPYLKSSTIIIAPNPFSENTVIYYNDKQANRQEVYFELYDILGKKQLELNLDIGANILNRNHLCSGIYYYRLLKSNQLIATGRVIIN